MFKLFVALALVAACSATYQVGFATTGTFFIDVGYDYIKVLNNQGDIATFAVDNFYGFNGPQTIWVQFNGKGYAPKTIKFLDEQTVISGRSQSDILYKIFSDYDGVLNYVEYEKLLNIVETYVQNNEIHPTVLYALKALIGQYDILKYFDQYLLQQGVYQQTPFYKNWGFLYGRNQGYGYNKFNQMHGMNQQMPGEYGLGYYNKEMYGPKTNVYQYLKGQDWYGYPQKYSGSFYGYQNMMGQYGYGYPQKFFGNLYGQQYGLNYGRQYLW